MIRTLLVGIFVVFMSVPIVLAQKSEIPKIQSQECIATADSGRSCIQFKFKFLNPLLNSALLDVSCGEENSQFVVLVPAQTRLEIWASMSTPVPKNRVCNLVRWTELK